MRSVYLPRHMAVLLLAGSLLLTGVVAVLPARAQNQHIGINIVLKSAVTDALLADLGTHGQVLDVIPEINSVTLNAEASELPVIQALSYVAGANPDRQRTRARAGGDLPVTDFAVGANLWNLDAINVTDFGAGRTVGYDGDGVFIAVLDSGLPYNWRAYFPEERIAADLACSIGGGGGERGTVSTQPEKWEHDTEGHGTRVTSILLGYRYAGPIALPPAFNGVAPRARVIPVRMLGNRDFTWSSTTTRSLLYVVALKVSGALGKARVVVNVSFVGRDPDAVERTAIDYALANGVVVVAAGGNEGEAGMTYPGAYPPVISVAAAAWKRQFAYDDPTQIEWILRDVAEADPGEYLVTGFSSRELPGQELDITAPGAAVPVALTVDGRVDYAYFNGTSPAAPHVAGVAALMLQKNPSLTQAQIESILKATAMPLAPGCRDVRVRIEAKGRYPTWSDLRNLISFDATVCWGANATGAGLLQADAALAATPMP